MSSQTYYSNSSNWGKSQYVTLDEVINNFMAMYVGYDKLIDNIQRYQVLFHAKRGIQELNYDAANQPKVLEVVVDSSLRVILPEDYINYSRISIEHNGILFKLSENQTANSAKSYQQNQDGTFIFDINGNLIEEQSELDRIRIEGSYGLYDGDGIWNGFYGYFCDDCWYFERSIGGAYWIDASKANGNPTFVVNKGAGVINFSSGIEGKRIVLEYISDGMSSNDPTAVYVHKFAEEFIYSYVKWCVLNNRVNIQEYIVRRAREEKSALLRNAKIRLSGQNAGKLLMILRGQDNWIK